MKLTFQLPFPDRALSPNARVHRAVRWKAAKAARQAARDEAKRVLGDAGIAAPGWRKAKVTPVLFITPDRKRPDPDNFLAMLKAYLDGIADCGVVINDRELWPERPEYRRVERMARVELTIEETE